MSNEAYLDQAEQNIVSLINQKRLRAAHDKCLEWLAKFPGEKRFLKLKSTIEDAVEDQNQEFVDNSIIKAKKHLSEQKYLQALEVLKPLLKLTKKPRKIESLIIEAQEKYKAETDRLQKEFIRRQRTNLDQLLKTDLNQLQSRLFSLEQQNAGSKIVKDLVFEYREKIIAKRIQEKSALINSKKYDDIYHFLEQLKKISLHSPQIENLTNKIKLRQHSRQLEQKKESIYENKQHLISLLHHKKYDKAIKVADEILAQSPGDKAVIDAKTMASKAFYKQTQEITIQHIKKDLPGLETQYKQEKEQFIKL